MAHTHQHRGGGGGGSMGGGSNNGDKTLRLCARLSIPHRVFRCLTVLCCALCLVLLGLSWTMLSPRTDSSGRPFVRHHRVRPALRVQPHPVQDAAVGAGFQQEPERDSRRQGEDEDEGNLQHGRGGGGGPLWSGIVSHQAGEDQEVKDNEEEETKEVGDEEGEETREIEEERERDKTVDADESWKSENSLSEGGGRVDGDGRVVGVHQDAKKEDWRPFSAQSSNDLPSDRAGHSDKGRDEERRQKEADSRSLKPDGEVRDQLSRSEGGTGVLPRKPYQPTSEKKVPQAASQDRAIPQNPVPVNAAKATQPPGRVGERQEGLRDSQIHIRPVKPDTPESQSQNRKPTRPPNQGLVRSQDQRARSRSQEMVRLQNQGVRRIPNQDTVRNSNQGSVRDQESAIHPKEELSKANTIAERDYRMSLLKERMEKMKEAEKQRAAEAARNAVPADKNSQRNNVPEASRGRQDTAEKVAKPPTTTTTKPRDHSADRNNQGSSSNQQKVPAVLNKGTDASGNRMDSCAHCFWSDFPAMIDDSDYCKRHSASTQGRGPMVVLLLISSAPLNTDKREAIRKTWGARCQDPTSSYRCLFVLGDSGSREDNEMLRRESERHRDILQFSFRDSYANLTYKTVTSLHWAARNCIQGEGGRSLTHYIMKTDDDMYVNTDLLPTMLTAAPAQRFVGGFCWGPSTPNRDMSSKWYVPMRSFRRSSFPPMCSGTGYVLSPDVVLSALTASENIPFFHLEDVYLALCLQAVKVRPMRIQGFNNIFVDFQACEYRRRIMTSHQVPTGLLERYWELAHQCPGTDPSAGELFVQLPYPRVN